MGLSSFFRKKPPETDANEEGAFSSRAEEESNAVRGRAKRKPGKPAAEPVDPVLPEKKRARRRLVGAVALVLAAIIGLPMILDSEPKPLGDDVVVQIPSKDQPAQISPVRSVASASTAGGPNNVPQGAALDQREEMVEPSTIPAARNEPAASAVPPKGTAASKPVAKPTIEPVVPVGKPVPKVDTKPKPEIKSEPKPAHVVVSEDGGDSARARSILDGTEVSGKAAQGEKATGKAAEKSTDKPADPATDKKPAKMMVQVAALASKEKVAELQDKLKAAGIVSHTQSVATDTGERIRVRIGPFSSREEAEKARSKLTSMGLSGALVPN